MELIKRVQFTKEQLIEAALEDIAAISDALQCYMPCAANKSLQKSLVLKEIALASLNAKPIGAFHIADQQVGATTDYIKDGEWPICNGVIEVYAAPPAPVVPKTLPCSVELKPGLIIGKGCKTETLLTALKRRADYYAELEALTPEQRAEHDAGIAEFIESFGNSGQLNSPVITEGWVMVPKEPTRQMMAQGHFAMKGTDRGKFRRIYQAMITAAPALNKGGINAE